MDPVALYRAIDGLRFQLTLVLDRYSQIFRLVQDMRERYEKKYIEKIEDLTSFPF